MLFRSTAAFTSASSRRNPRKGIESERGGGTGEDRGRQMQMRHEKTEMPLGAIQNHKARHRALLFGAPFSVHTHRHVHPLADVRVPYEAGPLFSEGAGMFSGANRFFAVKKTDGSDHVSSVYSSIRRLAALDRENGWLWLVHVRRSDG